MIISLLQEKGGVGKTTIAINLAHALQKAGYSVLLVDADAQGSTRDWHQANDGKLLEVIGFDRPTIDKDLRQFIRRYDIIIVDGAPRLSEMSIRIIRCSDIVLIPVQPSPYDVWAAATTVSLIRQRQELTGNTPYAAFVLSMQREGTRVIGELREAVKEYGLPVFENGTCKRVIYSETASKGKTVIDSHDEKARKEIEALTQEVINFAQTQGAL